MGSSKFAGDASVFSLSRTLAAIGLAACSEHRSRLQFRLHALLSKNAGEARDLVVGNLSSYFSPPPPTNYAPWSGQFTQNWTFADSASYAYTGTLSGLPSANGNYVCEIAFDGVAIRLGAPW